MHRCLRIAEIVRLILKELTSGKDLLRSALTCRHFLEPALEYKWSSRCNLTRLLATLPDDVINRNVSRYDLGLKLPPSPADWERPAYYGRWVRTLSWSASRGCAPLSSDDANALLESMSSAGVQLFPNLTELRINPDRRTFHGAFRSDEPSDYKSYFKILMASLPPALLSFHISVVASEWRGDIETELLTCLALHCVDLEKFSIVSNTSFDSEPFLIAINNLVRNATKLSQLVLDGMMDPLQQQTADHLATHSPLRHLECTPLDRDEWPPDIHVLPLPNSRIFGTECFRRLEGLSLYLSDWESAVCLLSSMKSCPLTRLALTTTSPTERPIMLSTLISTISDYSATLTHLTLRDVFQDDFLTTTTEYTIGHVPGSFEPLFELRRLQELDISMPISHYLDGPWLTEAADNWPDLRAITVSQEGLDLADPVKLPTINLADLAHLLRECPKIRKFSLSILYSPVPFDLYADIRKMNILSLHVQHSVVGSPYARLPDDVQFVFRCLVGMFPLLVGVHPSEDIERSTTNEATVKNWEAIHQLIQDTIPLATLDGRMTRNWSIVHGTQETSVSHLISGSN